MRIRWFMRGKWPRALVNLHSYTIVSFVLLLVTGVLLYLPAVHTPLIPYLRFLYQVHILLGLIFGATLLLPYARLIPKGRSIWQLDWFFPMMFGGAIVATGLLLWGVTVFPTAWRSPAFTWHGWLSYVLGGWVFLHAVLKTLGVRPPANRWPGKVNPERRQFLKWMGLGVLGVAVLTVGNPLELLARFSLPGGREGRATASGGDFPEYYNVVAEYPNVPLQTYSLHIDGAVAQPETLSWHDLVALPVTSHVDDFHCVTGWSVSNVHWEGIHLSELVARVQPSPSVKYVHFYSADGTYTECLSLNEALNSSVLLAYRINGAALRREAGFPLRLIVPKMYGYKSIKWVNRLEFSDKPIDGYWETRGYPTEAFF